MRPLMCKHALCYFQCWTWASMLRHIRAVHYPDVKD
jgi:hypothetical protein